MKELHRLIHGVMGTFAGIFVGRAAYILWDYFAHPQRYIAQSAPWYTAILVQGALTIAVLAVCVLLKIILICIEKRQRA